jgi:hypothetical protein
MSGLMELFGLRSKSIDDIITNSNKTVNNIFYDDMSFRDPLQTFVSKLEKVLVSNGNLQNYFGRLNKDIDRVDDMDKFLSHMENVDSVVGDLDSLVQVDDLSNLLTEINTISGMLKNMNLPEYTKKAIEVTKSKSASSGVENALKAIGAVIIVLIVFLLMAIVRKINESVKAHVF